MANDIADIGINVDTSSIVSAKKEMEDISKSFNSAAKSAATFMQAYDKAFAQQNKNTSYAKYLADVARANQTIINTNLGVTKSYKSAEDSAKMFVAMLNKQESAQKALNLQVAQQKAETGFALGSQQAKQLEELRLKYNTVYSASKLYEKELESLTLAQQLGAISMSQYSKKIELLNQEYQQFSNSAEGAYLANNRFAKHVNETGRGLNKFGFVAQQVGYQVGDFFVQIQSGTNMFVAFGQQATQLAGLLPGLTGAIVGIGISVATAFLSMSTRTKEAKEAANDYKSAIEALTASAEQFRLQRYGMDETRWKATKEIIDLETQITLEKQTQSGEDAGYIIYSNERIRTLQKQIEALNVVLAKYDAEKKALKDSEDAANGIKLKFDNMLNVANSLSKVDLSSMFSKASGPASNLLSLMGTMYNKAWSMANSFNQKYAQTGDGGLVDKSKLYANMGGRGVISQKDNYSLPNDWEKLLDTNNGASPSGGGGVSEDTIENKLKQVYDYLELDKYLIEQENISYSQREDTLKAALDKKLITLEEFQTAEKDLTIKHQAELAQIEQANYLRKLQDTSNLFGSLADIASAGGKKSAKAVATFQAIEGTINAYGAAIKALNTPGISLAGRFAAYASVLAAGLKGVSAIRSAGGVGGSSGGAGSVGTSPASAAASASPTTVMIQGMKPTDIFTGEQLSTLFDSLYKENNNRGMVFMVQR